MYNVKVTIRVGLFICFIFLYFIGCVVRSPPTKTFRPKLIRNKDGKSTSSLQAWAAQIQLCKEYKSGRLPCESEAAGQHHRERDAHGRDGRVSRQGDAERSGQLPGLPSVL